MDYTGLVYLAIFSFAWLFDLKELIESKDKKFLIIIASISGVLLMASVVLTWPKDIPLELKYYWRYVLVFIIIAEIYKTKYEILILPEKLKSKEGIEIKIDKLTIGFGIFITICLFGPGIYYGYQLAFA